MSQPRKYRLPPPPPMTVEPSSAEVVEVPPVPRLQLVVVLRFNPLVDLGKVALATARLISTLHAADRRLRLTVDPVRSSAAGGEVTLTLTPALWSVVVAERLERVAGVAREAITKFEGTTLGRVEVVPQDRSTGTK